MRAKRVFTKLLTDYQFSLAATEDVEETDRQLSITYAGSPSKPPRGDDSCSRSAQSELSD